MSEFRLPERIDRSSSRRNFPVALGAASLADCSGIGAATTRRTSVYQNPCPDTCDGGGGSGGATEVGGVDPSAWSNYKSFSTQQAKLAAGYDSIQSSEGGDSSVGGSRLFHIDRTVQPVSNGYQMGVSSTLNGTPQSGSFLVPQSVPQTGAYSNGLITLSNDVNAGTVTSFVTVEGVPCSITATTTDGAGYDWQVDYKNLNTGFVASFTATYPGFASAARGRHVMRFSQNACAGLILGGVIIGTFGLVLGFALLPEAAAIGGAYAALGGVVNVSNVVAWGMGVLSAAGC